MDQTKYIDIVFDGRPAPVSGRFVEVEDDHGRSIKIGEWVSRPDGFCALRLSLPLPSSPRTSSRPEPPPRPVRVK